MTEAIRETIREAEARARLDARLGALEARADRVNGSLDRIDKSLVAIKEALAGRAAGISLQNRQVAFIAAAGTIIYLLVEHVH